MSDKVTMSYADWDRNNTEWLVQEKRIANLKAEVERLKKLWDSVALIVEDCDAGELQSTISMEMIIDIWKQEVGDE